MKTQYKNNPIKLLSSLDTNGIEHRKRASIKLKSKTIKKMKSNSILVNKLLISEKVETEDEITKNNSKLFSKDLNFKNSNLNTIDYSNTYYSDRLRYFSLNKNKIKNTNKNENPNINCIDECANTIYYLNELNEEKKKKLAILKDGMIYWLRKLYIILPEHSNNVNYNHNLYIYFYYPIKDINIKIEKKYLYMGEGMGMGQIFCRNLEEILEKVQDFLKIQNYQELFKFCIYNEDYVLIKNDGQLMEKKDKYKILYVKIKKLSNEQINKKMKRCQFHRHQRKSCDLFLKINEMPLQFFTNKELKNKISIHKYFPSPIRTKTILSNQISYANIMTEDKKNDNTTQTTTVDNGSRNITSRKNENLLEGNSWASLLNSRNIFNNNMNRNFNRNNTDFKLFPKIFKNIHFLDKNKYIISDKKTRFSQKNTKDFKEKFNIPKIKSKGLWISSTIENINNINLLQTKHSQKKKYINNNKEIMDNKKDSKDSRDSRTIINEDSDNYIYSLSIDRNSNIENKINNVKNENKEDIHIYDKTHINNIYIKNILNNNYNKMNTLDNYNNNPYIDKKIFKKKFILKENIFEKDPCDDAFNIKLKTFKRNANKNSPIKINKNKQINNIIELNQIQFIALNNCIRNFVMEKIDTYINDVDIGIIFNKEIILKNIKEINGDIPLNLYLKEFLCFSYLSHYICDYYKIFCNDLFDVLKDYYIDINNILAIYKFREFIFNFKNIFHEIKYDKDIFEQKLIENNNKNKNNLNISFVFFILFMIYNKKNLSTLFDKELLFSILECIDIRFPYDINVEQFIKFKIYFIKNKWITHHMKKIYLNKFFNKNIFNNKNFDIDLFVIKLRPIMKNNSEDIKQITKNKLGINNNIDVIYNKFIEYFNF